jgi:hypothetical protein
VPIALVGSVTKSVATGVGIAPTGLTAGHVLIAFVQQYSGAVTSWASAGWTLLVQRNETLGINSSLSAAILYKVATSSEPANYTFTQVGGAGNITVFVAAYSGVSDSAPIDSSSGNDSAGDTSAVLGKSVAAAAAREFLIFAWLGDDNTPLAPPAGTIGSLTVQVDGSTYLNLDAGRSGYYDGSLVVAGPTGDYTFTATANDTWIVFMVTLMPASPSFQIDVNTQICENVQVCA